MLQDKLLQEKRKGYEHKKMKLSHLGWRVILG